MDRAYIVGVRHHSPACAKRVAAEIRRRRPRYVLIEGPADFNGRMGELRLGHQLPVALFTWYRAGDRTLSCWTPFCRYSPEWVAIEAAQEVGAEALFIDLPAWHKVFVGQRNRYADVRDPKAARNPAEDYTARLCERLGVDDSDTLWDHLFEQPADPEELGHWLDQHFHALRGETEGGDRDGPREAFMRRCVAWALRRGGGVVVVCGGWHQPALEGARAEEGEEAFPEVPEEVEEAGAEGATGAGAAMPTRGTYLVPYSYKRLDAFTGYEAGMPSPEWYDRLFAEGGDRAAEGLLLEVAGRLRGKKQPISTADLIACVASARGLQRLRGHAELARADILDGIAAALVKDGMEKPLPWSRRGMLAAGTDPLLVEVVRAFSGEREGRLAPGTPRPPLLFDVEERLRAADLEPPRVARQVRLQLERPADLARSRLLHRLRVLGISGFTRASGPEDGLSGELAEAWEIQRAETLESELIEAAAWGATLEAAALRRLEEALGEARTLDERVARIGDAVFVGVEGLAMRVVAGVGADIQREHDFRPVGGALAQLLGLWRGGVLLGAAGAAQLGSLVEALYDRGLWLLEGLTGPDQPADDKIVAGMLAMRDATRFRSVMQGGRQIGPPLDLPLARAAGVIRRCAAAAEAPPAVRGAALGWLFSGGEIDQAGTEKAPGEVDTASVEAAIRGAARPEVFGDFLYGLFATAREEITTSALLSVMDRIIQEMGPEQFLVGLPSLRLAFGWFPPRERRRLAEAVVALHGGDARGAHRLLTLRIDPAEVARGAVADRRARDRAARFGLRDALDGPPEAQPGGGA